MTSSLETLLCAWKIFSAHLKICVCEMCGTRSTCKKRTCSVPNVTCTRNHSTLSTHISGTKHSSMHVLQSFQSGMTWQFPKNCKEWQIVKLKVKRTIKMKETSVVLTQQFCWNMPISCDLAFFFKYVNK